MINLARAIQYPFSGDNALTKTMIGALMLLLLPVFFLTGLILMGYQLRVIRQVIDGDEDGLPNWGQAGHDLGQGLVVLAGSLLYYFPAIVLAWVGSAIAWEAISSINVTALLLEQEGPSFDRETLSIMCLTFALALIWLLLSAPLIMAAIAHYAETGEFSSFTRILYHADRVWEQRGAAGMLMLNLFLLAILVQVASAVLSFICVAGFYLQFIQFAAICHLNGQWGAHLKAHRPPPEETDPPKPPRQRRRKKNVIRPIKPPKR
ncbi:MAG: DUF4013 domain-containing protein [Chloroflexi bacterium]|nr:DUF4013 domain-containing protein [Chloroflexota bacterium]